MSRRHAITLKALFPILIAAILATGCSDATSPTEAKAPALNGPDQAPSFSGDLIGSPPSAQKGVMASVTAMVDLTPCQWSANRQVCYRSLYAFGPVAPISVAVKFDPTHAYIFVFDLSKGLYVLQYAVNRSDITKWYVKNGQWYPYQAAGIVWTGPSQGIMVAENCGVGLLCRLGLLDPTKVLLYGLTVPSMWVHFAMGL